MARRGRGAPSCAAIFAAEAPSAAAIGRKRKLRALARCMLTRRATNFGRSARAHATLRFLRLRLAARPCDSSVSRQSEVRTDTWLALVSSLQGPWVLGAALSTAHACRFSHGLTGYHRGRRACRPVRCTHSPRARRSCSYAGQGACSMHLAQACRAAAPPATPHKAGLSCAASRSALTRLSPSRCPSWAATASRLRAASTAR